MTNLGEGRPQAALRPMKGKNMWFIITDVDNVKHYLNTQYITNIFYKNDKTYVCYVSGHVEISGDLTKKLFEIIRMSGISIKQIGE